LQEALLTTGSDGAAATRLLIGINQDPRDVLVVVANVGPFSARAAISAEALG
jgi:hypothetical protein